MAKILMNDKIKAKLVECVHLIDDNGTASMCDMKLKFTQLQDSKQIDLNSLKELKQAFHQMGKIVYLHEIMEACDLYLPKYEPLPRNPELEARVQQLKLKFAEQEYQKMVRNVDLNSQLRHRDAYNANLGATDFRTSQGQLIAIFNMILVIAGAFAFGYKSVEYSLSEPNVFLQITAGFILALIVAIADIYFLIKKLLRVEAKEQSAGDAATVVNQKPKKQNIPNKSNQDKKDD